MTSTSLWVLLAIQIAMGAFDTLYHHEMTERLAWRPSQARELKLHAVRNMLYAALFLTLGWTETRGWFAIAVMAVLLVEVIITLLDFVEEDMSRKLPSSERINHTLLALNYGAILALLLPVLMSWAAEASSVRTAFHGPWSVLTAVSAFGVALFGVRDWLASFRAERLTGVEAATLATGLPARQNILVTGATGFIGPRLVNALTGAGHEVTVLVRNPQKALALRPPFRIIPALGQIGNDARFNAAINLAGEPIGNGLWTRVKRVRILRSRLVATRELVKLMARLQHPPSVLVNGSAIGWYGLRGDENLDETSIAKSCFSHTLCAAWERAAQKAEALGVRVVRLRIGLVLGTEGGLLAQMLTPFEFGAGGRLGSGQQWMSWIARDDLVRLIVHAIARPEISGPLNATAPGPVRNADFARALGRALHRPALLPAPAFLLRLTGDFGRELLLGGQKVWPAKALATGFVFRHPALADALGDILGSGAPRAANSYDAQFSLKSP